MTHGVVAQLPQRLGRAVPVGLLDLRLSPTAGRTALASPDAVTQRLATAKVFQPWVWSFDTRPSHRGSSSEPR